MIAKWLSPICVPGTTRLHEQGEMDPNVFVLTFVTSPTKFCEWKETEGPFPLDLHVSVWVQTLLVKHRHRSKTRVRQIQGVATDRPNFFRVSNANQDTCWKMRVEAVSVVDKFRLWDWIRPVWSAREYVDQVHSLFSTARDQRQTCPVRTVASSVDLGFTRLASGATISREGCPPTQPSTSPVHASLTRRTNPLKSPEQP